MIKLTQVRMKFLRSYGCVFSARAVDVTSSEGFLVEKRN